MPNVVTRFAPSPSGPLHLGGARTAIFNWLYARQHGGKFILRIEDTDKYRCQPEYVENIKENLTWLGLDWDEIHFQSARTYIYQDYINNKRDKDLFRQFVGAELRFYPQHSCDIVNGNGFVDLILGECHSIRMNTIHIARDDGSFTFKFTNVVDDIDMGVTHVIRGQDHITNTHQMMAVYKLLKSNPPEFAHIPLLHSAKGAKISKRNLGNNEEKLSVSAFRELGVLPEAMFSYLVRLGWGYKNEEFITKENALKWFDLTKVSKGPAQLDENKLAVNNKYFMSKKTYEEVNKFVQCKDKVYLDRLKKLFSQVISRTSYTKDIENNTEYLKNDFINRVDTSKFKEEFNLLAVCLGALDNWNKNSIKKIIEEHTAKRFLDKKDFLTMLRQHITNMDVSPPLYDILEALGKEESVKRLTAA